MSEVKIGTRFVIHGSNYEVTFVGAGEVRYAACAGGKVFRMPLEKFSELKSAEKIKLEYIYANDELTSEQCPKLIRRRRYIEAAITQLVFPTSKSRLQKLIPLVASAIEDTQPPSTSAVCKWIKKFREYGDEKLAVKHIGNQTLRFDPLVEQLITEGISKEFLQKERRDAQSIRDYVVGRLMESGLLNELTSQVKLPSLRTVQRRVKQIDPYVKILARQGEVAAQRYARASGQKITGLFALSTVEIDTHYLDVLVVDPDTGEVLGRPYLICIIDIKTRMVVGIHISLYPPSTVTSLAALKDMLVRYGIPAKIITDNGVEIKNTGFTAVCEILCIVITRAQVREPDNKPFIESFFRTLTYAITQRMPGTTFSSVAHRRGYDAVKHSAFTLTDVETLLRQWIETVYHTTVHTRTGRAPALHWRDEVRAMEPLKLSMEEVDKLIRRPVIRNVHNGRVLHDYIEYFSHALVQFENQPVTVLIDELNLHQVYVKSPDDKDVLILAESTDPEYTLGLNAYAHNEAKKIKADLTKRDIEKYGKNAAALSRYLLMQRLSDFAVEGKKRIKALLNGTSRTQKESAAVNDIEQNYPVSELKFPDKDLSFSVLEDLQPKALTETKEYDSFDVEF